MRSRRIEQRTRDGWGLVRVFVVLLASLNCPDVSAREPFIYQQKDGVFAGAPLDLVRYSVVMPTVIETGWDPAAEIAVSGDELFVMAGGSLYVRTLDGLHLGPQQLLVASGWSGKIAVARPYIYRLISGVLYSNRIDGTQVADARVLGTVAGSAEIAVMPPRIFVPLDGSPESVLVPGYLFLMNEDNLLAARLSSDGTLAERPQKISRGSWYGGITVAYDQICQSVGGFLYANPTSDWVETEPRPLGPQLLGESGWSGKIAATTIPAYVGVIPNIGIAFPPVPDPHNLLANGSFELPDTGQSGSGWYAYGSSPTADGLYRGASIPGWRIPGGNIDVNSSYWRAPNHYGHQSIDLAGNTPGTIEQTFLTAPGRMHLFSAFIAHNPGIRGGKAAIYLNGELFTTLSRSGPASQSQMKSHFRRASGQRARGPR